MKTRMVVLFPLSYNPLFLRVSLNKKNQAKSMFLHTHEEFVVDLIDGLLSVFRLNNHYMC